jgi:hypothetical protein
LFCFKLNQLPWRASKSSAPDKASRAPDTATQKAAEDPNPEPRGKSELTITVADLNLDADHVSWT